MPPKVPALRGGRRATPTTAYTFTLVPLAAFPAYQRYFLQDVLTGSVR